MSQPIYFNEFDAEKICFEGVGRNKRGGKQIRMTYDNRRGFILIETPVMYIPFGQSVFADENADNPSTALECRLNPDDPECVQFMEALKGIDEAVFQYVAQHDKQCFNEATKPDVIRVLQRSCIKAGRPKNDGSGNWPPMLRIKVSNFATPIVFDTNRNQVDWVFEEKKYKGFTARMIVQLQSVWFVNKQFGVSFRLVQMGIVDEPAASNVYKFRDDPSGVARPLPGIKAGSENEDDFGDDYD